MTAREDQQKAGGPGYSAALLRSAALAAELLEDTCTPGFGDPLRLEVARTLARDLKEELEALTALTNAGTGAVWVEEIEGALRAADVANLAACTLPELLKLRIAKTAAAAQLAAGAARALGAFVEAGAEEALGYSRRTSSKTTGERHGGYGSPPSMWTSF